MCLLMVTDRVGVGFLSLEVTSDLVSQGEWTPLQLVLTRKQKKEKICRQMQRCTGTAKFYFAADKL